MAVYMYILSEKERGDCVRAKRKLHRICSRFYLFILLDNIKGRTSCFFVGIVNHVCLCLSCFMHFLCSIAM